MIEYGKTLSFVTGALAADFITGEIVRVNGGKTAL
jgi:hypothetical protein